ncbi:MAG: hypothetical protein MUF51_02835, partial [Vicinamibacteria bacterium]|nr:hypothetical protein [Vicinamibacteria bacterium]
MTPQRTAERKTTGESRVVYYAMGGGHGHVARGTAVLCALGEGALICPGRMQSWPQHFGVATLVPPQETPDA